MTYSEGFVGSFPVVLELRASKISPQSVQQESDCRISRTHVESFDTNVLNRRVRRVQNLESSDSDDIVEIVVFGNLWIGQQSALRSGRKAL